MTDEQLLERIALNPQVMVGKPVIKGTRLTVGYILNLLAHGATATEILDEYSSLSQEDIHAYYSRRDHWKAPPSCLSWRSGYKCVSWWMRAQDPLLHAGFGNRGMRVGPCTREGVYARR